MEMVIEKRLFLSKDDFGNEKRISNILQKQI
jgi:hypothetical protein